MNRPAPFTRRQIEFFERARTSWFNVAEGGKRGSKNVLMTTIFCVMLENHPSKLHLIAGVSTASARLNIMDCDGYGLLNYFEGRCRAGKYQARDCLYISTPTGEKIVLMSGGGKDGDEKLIKGNSYGMAYITEANECHLNFIKEVFDRTLSSPDRKVFHDLNPKGPLHWYYTDILNMHEDNQKKYDNYGYNYGHFTIADNMSMTMEKIRVELRKYDKKSVWYQRDILGLRAIAEGLIYSMFRKELNTYNDETRPEGLETYATRYAAVDYGTQNAMVYLDVYDDGDTLWFEREYGYDGRKEKVALTNAQYGEAFDLFFADGPRLTRVVMDPSAASFKEELRSRNYVVKGADNVVLLGLQNTGTMMYKRKIKIHEDCVGLLSEIPGYIWDQKAIMRGIEQPLKENDHYCVTADTLVDTIKGSIPIAKLVGKRGTVRCYNEAKKRFTWSWFYNVKLTKHNTPVYAIKLETGEAIRATADHPVLTQRGWVPTNELTADDYIVCHGLNADVTAVKVISVEPAGTADVYNMQVINHHNFCVAGGFVIHNCDAMRYLVQTVVAKYRLTGGQ